MFDPQWVQSSFRQVPSTYSWGSQTPQQICGPNPNRCILYLSGSGANAWNLYLDGDQQRAPSFWPQTGTFQKMFTWQIDGNLPSLGWWAVPTVPLSSPRLSVLEVWFVPGIQI